MLLYYLLCCDELHCTSQSYRARWFWHDIDTGCCASPFTSVHSPYEESGDLSMVHIPNLDRVHTISGHLSQIATCTKHLPLTDAGVHKTCGLPQPVMMWLSTCVAARLKFRAECFQAGSFLDLPTFFRDLWSTV